MHIATKGFLKTNFVILKIRQFFPQKWKTNWTYTRFFFFFCKSKFPQFFGWNNDKKCQENKHQLKHRCPKIDPRWDRELKTETIVAKLTKPQVYLYKDLRLVHT
jgi:hypothetical protein